jgi:methionyl aminopeptidase
MMKANEEALKNALKIAVPGAKICEVGKAIHDRIVRDKFSPIRNLSGHQLERFMIHAGENIPNYDNGNSAKLENGVYAIEPFATTGEGIVQDGKPSGIYMLKEVKPVRDMQTRKILKFIEEEYNTLPFASRWIVKKFGLRALMSLNTLEQNGSLHHFSQLIEKSRAPVSQFEDSILIDKGKVIVLTGLN